MNLNGKAIGKLLDGCPAGVSVDFDKIHMKWIAKPGQSKIVTQRKEPDTVEFLSGIFEGMTTGTPIGFMIHNNNQKSKDYEHIKNSYRPSHADFVYDKKYGFRDYRGGGRSSARETAAEELLLVQSLSNSCLAYNLMHLFLVSVN